MNARYNAVMNYFHSIMAIHGIELVLHARNKQGGVEPYYVTFNNSDIKQDGFLKGAYGDGYNFAEAVINYYERIKGQVLVINAESDNRQEIPIYDLVCYKDSSCTTT